MSADIRKWFMKQHDKGNVSSAKPVVQQKSSHNVLENLVKEDEGSSRRRKTSKYFASASDPERSSEPIGKGEDTAEKVPSKRKSQKVDNIQDEVKLSAAKRTRKVGDDDDDDDDFTQYVEKKTSGNSKPLKNLRNNSGTGLNKNDTDESGGEDCNDRDVETPRKGGGRGKGGRVSMSAAGGRGRGGGFMGFGERKDPPHKGEKEVPEGSPDCLAGLTFVISGTLDSLEREEAEDLIKRHGGRVTGSVSKKTNYLLADEDVGGKKCTRAKELGTKFLTEDGLFDMIHKSKPTKTQIRGDAKSRTPESKEKLLEKEGQASSLSKKTAAKKSQSSISPQKKNDKFGDMLTWTEKYRPKIPNDLIGNQSIVKQLHDWLAHWHEEFLHNKKNANGKKQNDGTAKKAVLISGTPGIGKSTSAKLVSQMRGFHVIEVNASDNRGKADARIVKGVGGSTSNSIKELIGNEALSESKDWSKYPKSLLIMDEVDGMSSGDKGGVADLIASIKISKIPIICICNDRYSQKLKSLVNYCMLLNFRKPTKQQMAKRLLQISHAEGLEVNEIALEELAERVSGDMRMALNQLQYMSLSQSVIKYDDVREQLLRSAKDEDISPFTAVDKLFDFNGGRMRMDERIDLSMSDPDLVPLIVQENYINYRPASLGKDDNDIKRMNMIARAAESIGNGDIINVQIRRYRQWQLSQAGSFASSIIPAAFLYGKRETLEPGERNYNRFGGWLGKTSTMGKNLRLLEDAHIHILASQASNVDRHALRIDCWSHLLKRLTDPLRVMPKDAAVQKVVELMDTYSLSQEDFDTIVEISKFQGHPNPMDGIQPAVKVALSRTYKQGSSSRVVKSADLINLPGMKKAPKKRIASLLEPVENGLGEENGDALLESEEGGSDSEETNIAFNQTGDKKLQLDLQTDSRKGMQVQLDLKSKEGKSSGRKTPAGKARNSGSSENRGRGGSIGAKRKR